MGIFTKQQIGHTRARGGQKTNIVDIDGVALHSLTLNERYKQAGLSRTEYMEEQGITETEALGKHRYLYFTGTNTEKQSMKGALKLSILPYPKGDNKRYDASYEPKTQKLLF